MEVALTDSFVQAKQPFVDGLGERRVIVDARGDRLDVLRLKTALATTPSFESALRERASRVAAFHHESYPRLRTIETERSTGTLVVISEHVQGARLTTLLAAAERRSLAPSMPAVTCLVRQLVVATVAWREQLPDVVHGAIGTDRLLLTPSGRLMVVDYVLGSALEQLRYSRQQYWEELSVALPSTFKFAINARADVLQVGAVALALLLGRRLNASDRLTELPPDLRDSLPPSLRLWLLRALQLEPVGSFTSVLDAHAALDAPFGGEDPVTEQDALLLFMARCLALDVDVPAVGDRDDREAPIRTDDLPDVDLATRIDALRAFLARRSAQREPVSEEPVQKEPEIEPDAASQPAPEPWKRAETVPEDKAESTPPDRTAALPDRTPPPPKHERRSGLTMSILPDDWTRRLWIAAAAVLALGALVFLLVLGIFPGSGAPSTGALSITTRPPGVGVRIDGTPRGVTPLSIELATGDHIIELVGRGARREVPVTIRAGSESSHFLEMEAAPAATTATELRIRTEPIGAAVTIDGKYIGQSPVIVGDLTPGPHTVVLKHEAGTATEQVLIEEGKAASLFVPLTQQSAGTTAGWISVPAPVDLQLFEGGRLLGSSRIDRIMLPAGRHDIDIVNDVLGFSQRHTVRVTEGQVTSIKLAWPTGTLAINAVPWAEAFVDSRSVGETPIGGIQVPIGQHEILLRHPQLGERSVRVTVTTRETARVGVDLRAK
jgi:hypothetical protein